jgi:hypothetical protein
MSQIRYRIFTERGSSRAPVPFNQESPQDPQYDSKAQFNADLTDRKSACERDEIAASVILGYN